jgi:hypothetical protein
MSDEWLEIADDVTDVEEIMRRIRERIATRGDAPSVAAAQSPEAVADSLWSEMIADPSDEFALGDGKRGEPVAIRQRDCDIVPRYYVIDWRVPILGPINAIVRRLINTEIRRYLLPSLEKQSRFNRKVRRVLKDLVRENARLRQELDELRSAGK